MPDPSYWYWASYSTTQVPPPTPSVADIVIAVLTSIAVLTLLGLAFALWDRKDRGEPSSGLDRHERHVLAVIERGLRTDDPAFVTHFRDLLVQASNPSCPSWLSEETDR